MQIQDQKSKEYGSKKKPQRLQNIKKVLSNKTWV
jgi:hypothetical protein